MPDLRPLPVTNLGLGQPRQREHFFARLRPFPGLQEEAHEINRFAANDLPTSINTHFAKSEPTVQRQHRLIGRDRRHAYFFQSQNTEGQITTPGRPSDANVNAAAVGIDCL